MWLTLQVCSAEPRCWRTMKQLGQRPALSRQRHFRVLSCRRRAWAFFLPAASHFSWRRQEHRSGRVSETQPESSPGGTDCCCRPIRAGPHISPPVAIVSSISSAATLVTVLLGARVLAYGTRTVSRGVALVRKPWVDGARVQRVVRSPLSHVYVCVLVRSVLSERRLSDSHARETGLPWQDNVCGFICIFSLGDCAGSVCSGPQNVCRLLRPRFL